MYTLNLFIILLYLRNVMHAQDSNKSPI